MSNELSIITGESESILKTFGDSSIDACITDPPYGMGMGDWDHTVPPTSLWREVYRVLKPGAFCLSFCSPQLYHRMAVAVEDAGFTIQDQIMWMVTTKMAKTNRLKPAHEPIAVAQKPYEKNLKYNQERYGVGLINIEQARVPWDKEPPKGWVKGGVSRRTFGKEGKTTGTQAEFGKTDANPAGRYPSNIIGEVLPEHQKYFYAPRSSRKEKGAHNVHPTVKPLSLMEYLVKIYSHEGNIVLDPFSGSGTTGLACKNTQRGYIGIDMSEEYSQIARERLAFGQLPI